MARPATALADGLLDVAEIVVASATQVEGSRLPAVAWAVEPTFGAAVAGRVQIGRALAIAHHEVALDDRTALAGEHHLRPVLLDAPDRGQLRPVRSGLAGGWGNRRLPTG